MSLKKRINKFIEKDLNSQYQTNIKVEGVLKELDIDINNEEIINYYKKRAKCYLRLSKSIFAICLTLVLITVTIFTIKQNQLIKSTNKFFEYTIMSEYSLRNEEFDKLIREGNRILREPICSLQVTNNVYVYVYYGTNNQYIDYYILVHFLERPNKPLRILVNNEEVMCTTTRQIVGVSRLDLTQEGVENCLDFMIEYNNNLRRFIVWCPINE